MSKLSNLQCDDGECRKEDGRNPEAHGDFGFVPRTLGPVAKDVLTSRYQLFGKRAEGIMNWCAFKEALHSALALAPFEVLNLENDTQVFSQEYPAEDGE